MQWTPKIFSPLSAGCDMWNGWETQASGFCMHVILTERAHSESYVHVWPQIMCVMCASGQIKMTVSESEVSIGVCSRRRPPMWCTMLYYAVFFSPNFLDLSMRAFIFLYIFVFSLGINFRTLWQILMRCIQSFTGNGSVCVELQVQAQCSHTFFSFCPSFCFRSSFSNCLKKPATMLVTMKDW